METIKSRQEGILKNINSSFNIDFKKGEDHYEDTPENRKLGRVGLPYKKGKTGYKVNIHHLRANGDELLKHDWEWAQKNYKPGERNYDVIKEEVDRRKAGGKPMGVATSQKYKKNKKK